MEGGATANKRRKETRGRKVGRMQEKRARGEREGWRGGGERERELTWVLRGSSAGTVGMGLGAHWLWRRRRGRGEAITSESDDVGKW
jgi:hypothetical protein